jgi:uncharacterized membrane protein YfcA
MTGTTAYICCVIFLASLCRSTLGFGEALLAMPLLAFVLPTKAAAPLVAMIGILTASLILSRHWRSIHPAAAWRLTLSGMLAIPLGVWWLSAGDDRVAKLLLGMLVVLFASWSLLRPGLWQLHGERWAPAFGFAAGLLSGAYNTGGPPLVIYGTLRRWQPATFRATLQSYCLIGGAWIVTMHGVAGLLTLDVLRRFLWCVPSVLLASLVGPRLTRRLPVERFVKIVHVVLLALGCYLLISSWVQSRGG